MQLTKVKSSNIAALGWEENPESSADWVATGPGYGVMEVKFHSGDRWQYRNVSKRVYDLVFNAPSIGTAFHAQIRTGPYPAACVHQEDGMEKVTKPVKGKTPPPPAPRGAPPVNKGGNS